MGFKGFLWVQIMEDDISEHSTNFSWVLLLGNACQQHTVQNIMGSRG
jgi:hypothetical protein